MQQKPDLASAGQILVEDIAKHLLSVKRGERITDADKACYASGSSMQSSATKKGGKR